MNTGFNSGDIEYLHAFLYIEKAVVMQKIMSREPAQSITLER